jgi:hypothetical protein
MVAVISKLSVTIRLQWQPRAAAAGKSTTTSLFRALNVNKYNGLKAVGRRCFNCFPAAIYAIVFDVNRAVFSPDMEEAF